MTEPVKRGKPLRVTITLDDALDDATLRSLAFCERSSIAKEARLALQAQLARVRSSSPELTQLSQLLVANWEEAAHGTQTHAGKGHLRVVDGMIVSRAEANAVADVVLDKFRP